MIIKAHGGNEPASPSSFRTIDILKLSSSDLRDCYALEIGEFGMFDCADIVAALAGFLRGEPLRAAARLLDTIDFPKPCYIGWRETGDEFLDPFLTDGPTGRWSLFFSADGRASVVEQKAGQLLLTANDLLAPAATHKPGFKESVLTAVRRPRLPWKRLKRPSADGGAPPAGLDQQSSRASGGDLGA